MRRRIRTAVAWLLLSCILLGQLPLLSLRAAAQKRLPVSEHAQAVKVLARHLAGGLDLPDSLLKRCNFHPAVGNEAWARVPPAYKIEAAYHAAEAASPAGGGEVWLALLAQELARRYDAAAYDPLLRRLLAAGEVEGCPSFDAPKPARRRALSQRHRTIINRLASYCGGAAVGHIADAVARDLDIPFAEARALFGRHGYDVQAGLEEALGMVSPEKRLSKMRALFERIASRYESAREDPELRALNRPHPFEPQPTPEVRATADNNALNQSNDRDASLVPTSTSNPATGLPIRNGGGASSATLEPAERPRIVNLRAAEWVVSDVTPTGESSDASGDEPDVDTPAAGAFNVGDINFGVSTPDILNVGDPYPPTGPPRLSDSYGLGYVPPMPAPWSPPLGPGYPGRPGILVPPDAAAQRKSFEESIRRRDPTPDLSNPSWERSPGRDVFSARPGPAPAPQPHPVVRETPRGGLLNERGGRAVNPAPAPVRSPAATRSTQGSPGSGKGEAQCGDGLKGP